MSPKSLQSLCFRLLEQLEAIGRKFSIALHTSAAPWRAEPNLAAAAPAGEAQEVWLVHGSTKGEAWIDAAYADQDLAIAAAVEEAEAWGSSYAVNLTAVAAELYASRSALVGGNGSEIWISVEPIEMRRKA